MNTEYYGMETHHGELDRTACTGEREASAEEEPQARGGKGRQGMETVKALELAWEESQNK